MAEPIATTLATTDKPSHYKELTAEIVQGRNENGPDVVATITTDSVDADGEVVLSMGGDFSRFQRNPVVMLCHAHGRPGEYYPLPVAKALWIKPQAHDVASGLRFARSSAMGREVQGLFREDILRTFSIGFLSLESSPPTRAEIRMRPDWADANTIHRKWILLEYSIVPIPCNQDAIGRYVGKGRSVPSFLWLPSHTNTKGVPVDENETPVEDAVVNESGHAEHDEPTETSPAIEPTLKRPSLYGSTYDGPDAEMNDAYRSMAIGLLARHRKIMHCGKAGHLYASPDSMTAHMVRHKDDDDPEMMSMGYHSAEQCKAMLGSAPHCKGVSLGMDHPEEGTGYERLHPPPANYRSATLDEAVTKAMGEGSKPNESPYGYCPQCGAPGVSRERRPNGNDRCENGHTYPASTAKAMGEGSGVTGGHMVGPEVGSANPDDHAPIDSMPEEAAEGSEYVPKAGHFVKWMEHKGMHGGCGKVMSVHKAGRVPDTANDADADDENPHARVKLYKSKADDPHAYKMTTHHVAVACKMCKRMPMVESADEEKSTGADVAKMVVPFVAGPVSDEAWDAAAAKKRIARWASSDGSGDKDTIDWAKYAKAFTVCEGPKDDFGSYKLPHHDVKGGKLVVVKSAVNAALAALGGARGGMSLPESDKSGAESHLKKHEKEWGGGSDKTDEKSLPVPAFRTRAQVVAEIERGVLSKIDHDAIHERARVEATKQLLGSA